MKTDIKIILGGVSAVLLGVGAIGLFVAMDGEPASPSAEEARAPEPVPSPRLEPALANTHAPRVEAPVVTPEPERSYAPELADGPVRARRLIVATGVEGHEPTGAADVLELGASSKVYAFVEAVNETDAPVELRVTFEPEGAESVGHVTLEVPANAPRYRTWAFTRHIYEPGEWEAVVRTGDGDVIARRPFTVE